MDVIYILGKSNIVPDALLWLLSRNKEVYLKEDGELDVLYGVTLVELLNDFWVRIVAGYLADDGWTKIMD